MPSCRRRAWSTIIWSTATATRACADAAAQVQGPGAQARMTERSDERARRAGRSAPGSACCRGAGSICSIPRPRDIEIEDIAHGLARVARWNGQTVGEHAFSVAQHALLVEEIAIAMQPDLHAPLAAGSPAARCARVRDRRPHQPVQGGHRPRLQGLRAAAAGGHPPPLRPAAAAARAHHRRDQDGRPRGGLLRGDAAGGLHPGRGQPLFRRAARRARGHSRERLQALDPVSVAEAQAAFLARFDERSQGCPFGLSRI